MTHARARLRHGPAPLLGAHLPSHRCVAGRVHRAWSDPEELASWFPRQVEGSLTVGARAPS